MQLLAVLLEISGNECAMQGGFNTPEGGLSIKNLSVLNPFDPNAKPINLRFSAERPSFQLPQVRLRVQHCSP